MKNKTTGWGLCLSLSVKHAAIFHLSKYLTQDCCGQSVVLYILLASGLYRSYFE